MFEACQITLCQYQFCNGDPKINACTDLNGLFAAASNASSLGLNDLQNATLNLFAELMFNIVPLDLSMVGNTNFSPLKATETLQSFISFGLPNNQWQIELQGWEAYVLATIQKMISDRATGIGSDYYTFVARPQGQASRYLCGCQKMRAPNGFRYVLLGVRKVVSLRLKR